MSSAFNKTAKLFTYYHWLLTEVEHAKFNVTDVDVLRLSLYSEHAITTTYSVHTSTEFEKMQMCYTILFQAPYCSVSFAVYCVGVLTLVLLLLTWSLLLLLFERFLLVLHNVA